MALPVGKVVTTVIRTWCRPAANRLVESAAKHHMVNVAILFIGRTYIRGQNAVARSEADVTKKADDSKDEGGAAPGPAGGKGPLTPEQQAAESEYWAKVAQGLLPFRRARRRPKVPEPTEEEMRRAGAFVVVEAFVYGLMIGVVWWEYMSSSADAKAKAEALEARFTSLEARIAELQAERAAATTYGNRERVEAEAPSPITGAPQHVEQEQLRKTWAAWCAMGLLALALGPFAA